MPKPLKRAVVVHQKLTDPQAQDQIDTLIQAKTVYNALQELGYFVEIKEIDVFSCDSFFLQLKNKSYNFVFNLVENEGKFLHLFPTLLELNKIPFSGCSSSSIYLTTNKVLTKKILRFNGLPTANWHEKGSNNNECTLLNKKIIIKSIVEDASINIDDSSVGFFKDIDALDTCLSEKEKKFNDTFFAEEYIDGREFNISLIGSLENPIVLPPAEIQFINYPKEKAKIVSYVAKWAEDTFEYQNTVRNFEFGHVDKKLIDELKDISIKCWKVFQLNGYARVDFRVDKDNRPWVLEINTNPGISEDSGFVVASKRNNLSYSDMIKVIIQNIRELR